MKLVEVTGYHSQSRQILNEGWQELTETQRIYLNRFERELWPLLEELQTLLELQLTADQVKDIFQGAEDHMSAAGKNRSMVGKGVDAAGAAAKLPGKVLKAIDDKINELGRMAGEAGPVKNIDAKFEELKKKISTDNPKVAEKIKAVSDWAKENPTKASIALGIMTAAAGFAGAGTTGGLAVLFFLNSALNLLKGDKLSAAVGKAAKTTGYAALAGMAFKALSNAIIDNIATGSVAEFDAMEKAMKAANLDAEKAAVFDKLGFTPDALEGASRIRLDGNINNFYYNYDTVLSPDQISQFDKLRDAISGVEFGTDKYYQAAGKFHDFMAAAQNNPQNFKLKVSWEALEAAEQQIKNLGDGFLTRDNLKELMAGLNSSDQIIKTIKDIGDAGANIIQGVVGAAKSAQKDAVKATKPDGEEAKKEESASMDQRFDLYLAEKEGEEAETGEKKQPGMLGRMAKNLTTKVTADKLMKQWKKMGEPTDVGSIMNILNDAGLETSDIDAIQQSTNIKLKTADAQTQAEPDAGAQPSGKAQPGKKQPAQKRNPKIKVAKGAGQMATAKDGETYVWAGAQWVNNKNNKVATKQVAAELGNPVLKSLADEIKSAKVADQVKQMLTQKTTA